MSEVVALRHRYQEHGDIVVIDWGVSNVCNYACEYCPPRTHQGDFPFVPVEDILGFADRVSEHYRGKLKKDLYFILTGGEVTLFDDFLPLIKTFKEKDIRVGISSNGFRELDFWKEAAPYLSHISLSYHDEFTDLDHFIAVVNTVKDITYTHVNIMVAPSEFEKCMNAADRVFAETDNITLDVQIVLREFVEPYPYTEEQRRLILEKNAEIQKNLKMRREKYGYRSLMKLVYSDGTEQLTKPGDLITKKMHSWKGWKCHVGLELLVLDLHGNIFRSWCGDSSIIGNIKDPVINFPETPHVCSKEWCPGGVTDILMTKEKY